MRPLQTQDMLTVWERGAGAHPVDRALALLACALPESRRDELANLSVGRRDRLLFGLRRATFGEILPMRTQCPRCGEQLEFDLPCADLCTEPGREDTGSLEVCAEGYRLRVRLPDSFDLAAIARETSVDAARRTLLERCVLAARSDGRPVAAGDLPEALVSAAATALAEADSCAEVLIDLACPACAHAWQGELDIASFLWAEIDARAQRLLLGVHRLASAYGWTEAEILALIPARRELYLQMVAA